MKVRASFPFDATTLIVPSTGSFRAGPNDWGRLFAVAHKTTAHGEKSMSDEEPRIFVDEDWKAKVQREREEAKKAAEEQPEQPAREAKPPEGASFEALISSLTMQAMVALGVMAPRDAKEVLVDLIEVKYLIDMLMMLRDKTKGNLTPKEQGFLSETLAELQQGYVVRSQQVQEAALRNAGVMPPDATLPEA